MICFELTPAKPSAEPKRTFIGGAPLLPANSTWPDCRICGDVLVHFLSVELPEAKSIGFNAGSILQIFACRQHDDIAGTIYSGYNRYQSACASTALPSSYWEISDGHYLIRLLQPDGLVAPASIEKRLAYRALDAIRKEDSKADPLLALKLFGYPNWWQDPEEHVCSCGAKMRLLLQIPDNFGFDMAQDAPEQPNSFSAKQYCLFLGNQLYLLACERQCHPMALLPVLQND